MGSEHPEKTIAKVNIILMTHDCVEHCAHSVKTQTCELTAQELHSQCAVFPADLWVNADVLRFNRWAEGVGRGAIVIGISCEYLH